MNFSKRDYYNVLSLKNDCNSQDIKKSYRILALRWHPDKHDNQIEATTKFNEIHEAYSVLKDSKQRKIYDQHGHRGIERFQENGDIPAHSNMYFAKGFQGTDKSAFEVLWDIINEKEENLIEQPDVNYPFSSDFDMNFFDHIKEDTSFENDEHFLRNYQPTFTRSEFLTTSQDHSTLFTNQNSNHIQDQSCHQTKTRAADTLSADELLYENLPMEFLFASTEGTQQKNSSHKTKENFTINRNRSIIIIDDDEDNIANAGHSYQAANPFMDQLNEFQNVLDQFHKNLEENFSDYSGISPRSKKIAKQEKVLHPSRFSKNINAEVFNTKSISIFS